MGARVIRQGMREALEEYNAARKANEDIKMELDKAAEIAEAVRQEIEHRAQYRRLNGGPAPIPRTPEFQSFWLRDQLAQGESHTTYFDPDTSGKTPAQPKPTFERGDIVEIDAKGDLNHGREGPVYSVPPTPGQPYQVWSEDGLLQYPEKSLKYPRKRQKLSPEAMDALPIVSPQESSAVSTVGGVTYPHPYHIHPANMERRRH